MAEYNDEPLEHEYDGIKELDNNLPRWWLGLFYLSIIWSVLYMFYYHVAEIGYLQEDEYRLEIDPNYTRAEQSGGKLLGIIPEYRTPFYSPAGDVTPRSAMTSKGIKRAVLLTFETDTVSYLAITDPILLNSGRESFAKLCSQCHGKLGEGGVGPNVTDDYWLHGNVITNIVKSVTYGYPAKGMIAWRGTLAPDDIINVSSFLMTLHGTNPPNGRGPQGELVEN